MNAVLSRLLAAAILVTLFHGQSALAQAPLVLEWRTKMKFGKVAPETGAGGTVVLSPTANTTTITGSLTDFGGTIRRGKLKITGEPKTFVIVTAPSSFTLRKGSSSHTMTVTNITMNFTNPIKLNKNGIKNVQFGATLTVAPNQRKGSYNDEGGFIIDVVYQ